MISLDFELFWGVRDVYSLEEYGTQILGVWEVFPKLLNLLERYETSVTFATVGCLFAADQVNLLQYVPTEQPEYVDANLSPYKGHFEWASTQDARLHYALPLIRSIKAYPRHELATHTMSHYYCLEAGQSVADFRADLESAIAIAAAQNVRLESLVFPRNQFNAAYLEVCANLGIRTYRGNEEKWMYQAAKHSKETLWKRAARLLDSYMNLSGYHAFDLEKMAQVYPYNLPSSRFLRPYSPRLRVLEGLRLRRIKKGMTRAAREGLVYHLWWHPHNFGMHQAENLAFLERILAHYRRLESEFGFASATMAELATKIEKHYGKKDRVARRSK